MNTKSGAWTGRAPRSMAEAFNPYTSDNLQPMRDSRDYCRADVALYVVSIVALAVVIILVFLER